MNALKVVAMRIRGTTSKVLEEMGEDTEGLIESTSKLREQIKGLTAVGGNGGIDILADDGSYKSTYEILLEISKVFDKIDDKSQAALLEILAGKQRGSVVAAILQSGEMLEAVYKSAEGAGNSAMHELETYLDSIQGRIDIFNNSVQTMWMNTLDSGFIKLLVDAGTWLVELIDKVGLLQSAIIALGAYTTRKYFGDKLFGGQDILGITSTNKKDLEDAVKRASQAYLVDPSDHNLKALSKAKSNLKIYEQELKNVKDTLENVGNTSQSTGEKIKNGFKNAGSVVSSFGKELLKVAKSMAAMYAITAAIELIITLGTKAFDYFKQNSQSVEVLHDKYQEFSDKLSNCQSELSSLESDLETTNKQIEELMSQGSLTFAEQEELERLQGISAELERQIDLKQRLQEGLQKSVNDTALRTADAYLNTSFDSEKSKTERQEEAKENGELLGKAAFSVIGSVLAPTLANFGTKLAATAATGILSKLGGTIGTFFGGPMGTLAGMAVGMGVGKLVGGWVGSMREGSAYDQEQTVGSAIENMQEERAKLEKATNDAYKAYIDNPEDADKAEIYNSAAQALSLYDEKMAKHINTLSQYYNDVDWESATDPQKEAAKEIGDMLDKYAIEMGGTNAKQNAIERIFGTEASAELQRVKSELNEMADAGEKIDLQKAFGDNTEAYDEFISRLHDLGIYVYECEDAFKKLKAAEEAAAEVNFSGVVNHVSKITSTISGVKEAFDEFRQDGSLSIDTALSLQEYFNTDELKSQFEEYLGVMMSGNASIEEARNATADLAQAYLQEKIDLGPLTEDQKAFYESLFKKMGIANADEFIKKELQQSGIEEISKQFNKALGEVKDFTGPLSPDFSTVEDFAASKLDMDAINEIIDKYELEADVVDQLIEKLKEKAQLETNRDSAKTNKNDYDRFFYGDETTGQKGYKQLKEDIGIKQKEIEDALSEYSNEIKEFDARKWIIVSDDVAPGLITGYQHAETGEFKTVSDYNELSSNNKAYKQHKENAEKELQQIKDAYQKVFDEGVQKGFLNEDGTIKEGVEEGFAQALSQAEAAVKAKEAEIDAEFTVDFDLKFTEELKENTFSALTESVAEYKAVLKETSEVVADGQVVSEEYKNSLIELGISHAELKEYFDDTNPLLVKNAKGLNNLVAAAKKSTAQNIKLARSNARLDYYELYKEMQKCFDENGNMLQGKRETIMALYEEMGALQKAISKYAILEEELLGATSAYDKFVAAQEADSATDYISNIEDMVLALGEALSTGKLGTETAQAAINGLFSDDFFKRLETLGTVEEKMAAINKEFREGKISQYFTLEFDDNGAIESAEMKLGNLRKFIEDGLSDIDGDGILNDVFSGSDWQHFEFSEGFLAGLDEHLKNDGDGLDYFAKKMDVSRDVAFAFLKTLEDYDIEWLGGDYSSLLERIIPPTFEGKIYDAILALSDLEAKFARGDIGAEEYAAQYNTLKNNIADLGDEARNQVNEYNSLMAQIEAKKKIIDDAYAVINDPQSHTKQEIDIAYEDVKEASEALVGLYGDLKKVEEPQQLTIQYALDSVVADINVLQSEIQAAFGNKVVVGENGELELNASLNISVDSLNEDELSKWNEYQSLLNEKHSMEINADPEDAQTALNAIEDAAGSALEAIKQVDGSTITINTLSATTNVEKLTQALRDLAAIGSIEVGVQTPSVSTKHQGGKWLRNATSSTVQVNGTAHATGNWGLPNSEHDALVGELGTELVNL